jgi:hypothetical protein
MDAAEHKKRVENSGYPASLPEFQLILTLRSRTALPIE